MERYSLPSVLDPVIQRKFYKDQDNKRLLVNMNGSVYPVHDDFRLFLSTSSSLYVRGDETRQLPIGHCNVIDLSLSQQSHIDKLLTDIMRVERPEFETQARSIEGGILHHKQELLEEHVRSRRWYNLCYSL